MTKIEQVARVMALYSGWDNWDTAADCRHTLSGNEPAEEREYWLELAKIAASVFGHEEPCEGCDGACFSCPARAGEYS